MSLAMRDSATLNQAICAKTPLGEDYQKVKMSSIGKMCREDLSWLAGFFDGEGNINMGFYGNGQKDWKVFRISCLMANTNADSIQKASQILFDNGINFTVQFAKKDLKRWRTCFRLTVNGQRNSYKFLRAILEFLTNKKELAKQCIYAYEYRQTLIRAGNNQFTKKPLPRVQDDPILLAMCNRARELVSWRPNPMKYSRQASQPIKVKKPSTAIRMTAFKAEDMVWTG